MGKEIINRPYKSHWIGGMYIIFTIFIALISIITYYFAELYQEPYFYQAIFSIVMLLVFILILITTVGFYTTKYKIKDGILTSWSPFVAIKLRLKDIKKIQKTAVPLHFRVGSSFYSGYFYVPSIGWVRTIITNLKDALLISSKDDKYYMITPSNPERFMKTLKRV